MITYLTYYNPFIQIWRHTSQIRMSEQSHPALNEHFGSELAAISPSSVCTGSVISLHWTYGKSKYSIEL